MRTHLLLAMSVSSGSDSPQESPVSINLNGKRYDRIYGYMPADYSRRNFYALLLQLEREGFIARSEIGGERVARITQKGTTYLQVHNGLVGLNATPWDGKWRIVLYDIKEKDRYLRTKIRIILERTGLRRFHESLYLSPYPVEDTLKQALAEGRLLDFVTIFSARAQELGDARELAVRTWGIEALQRDYESLLRRLPIVLGQQVPERRRSGLRRIKSEFITLVKRDPMLPQALLPVVWPFKRAYEILGQVR